MHWAAKYIGLPWSEVNDCWWLVRSVIRDRWGIDLPVIADLALKEAARIGWRQVTDDAKDGDVVLGRDVFGRRHVGLMVEDRGRMLLLHNDGHMTNSGPVGSVVAQPLRDVVLKEIELWRR